MLPFYELLFVGANFSPADKSLIVNQWKMSAKNFSLGQNLTGDLKKSGDPVLTWTVEGSLQTIWGIVRVIIELTVCQKITDKTFSANQEYGRQHIKRNFITEHFYSIFLSIQQFRWWARIKNEVVWTEK